MALSEAESVVVMRSARPLGSSDSVQVIRLCWAAITDGPRRRYGGRPRALSSRQVTLAMAVPVPVSWTSGRLNHAAAWSVNARRTSTGVR